MTNLDPKHLDALIMSMRKMERQMSFQSRDLAGAKNCRDAIDKITALRAENDRLSNLWQIEHDHATALRAQIDRERAATIEAAARWMDMREAAIESAKKAYEQRSIHSDPPLTPDGYCRNQQHIETLRHQMEGMLADATAIRALHTDATRAAMDAIRREGFDEGVRQTTAFIRSVTASIPPDPDTNADSRHQAAPKVTYAVAAPFRFDAKIEWRGHDDAWLVFAASPTGEWVRAADHDILVTDLQTLLARTLVMDRGSAEEAAEALGGFPQVIHLVETHHATHPRPGNPTTSPDPDEVEF